MVEGDKLRQWKKEHLYRLSIDLNRDSADDAPIIEKLESVPNKSAYIKGLVRRDIDEGNAQ